MVLIVLFFVPEIARVHWPSAARFFPPFLLTSLAATSFGYAFLVWRTRQFCDWLFPGCVIELPVRTEQEKKSENLGAAIGVIVSSVLFANWFWKLL